VIFECRELFESFIVIHFFFACTFAATFTRGALSRMNPLASSWLQALGGSASIVAPAILHFWAAVRG